MNFFSSKKNILIPCLLLVLGKFFTGDSKLPDEYFGWRTKIGVFLLLLFFISQIVQWGSLILRRLVPELSGFSYRFSFALALGAAFLSTVGTVFGCLGIIGQNYAWIYLLFLLLPVLFQKEWIHYSRSFSIRSFEGLMIITLLIGVFTYALDGFDLKHNGDVFNYHLPPTRLWFNAGKIGIVPDFLSAHQAGAWDSLHLWGLELLGGPDGRGLVAVQHFAQWSQILIAWGGVILILVGLFQSLGLKLDLALACALAGVSVQLMVPTYAKNDWGSIFWTLSGIAYAEYWIAKKEFRIKHWLIAGILLGSGITSKWTTLFCVLPWGVAQLFRIPLLCVLEIGVSTLVGGLPILIRNFIQTGNPVFPAYNHFFKSPYIVPSLQLDLSRFQANHFEVNFSKFWFFFSQVTRDIPYAWICLLPLVLVRRKNRGLAAIYLSASAGVFLFIGGMTNEIQGRLAGPILVLWIASSIAWIGLTCEPLFRTKLARALQYVILVACSHFPLYALSKSFKFVSSDQAIERMTRAEYKHWIREHIPLGTKLVISDNEFYYLLGYRFDIYPDFVEFKYPDQDIAQDLDNPKWLIDRLHETRAAYWVLNVNDIHLARVLDFVQKKWPDRVVFRSGSDVVIRSDEFRDHP